MGSWIVVGTIVMASDTQSYDWKRTPTANYKPDGTTKVFLMAVRLRGWRSYHRAGLSTAKRRSRRMGWTAGHGRRTDWN